MSVYQHLAKHIPLVSTFLDRLDVIVIMVTLRMERHARVR